MGHSPIIPLSHLFISSGLGVGGLERGLQAGPGLSHLPFCDLSDVTACPSRAVHLTIACSLHQEVPEGTAPGKVLEVALSILQKGQGS